MMAEMDSFSCVSIVLLFSFLFVNATTQRTNSINNVITIFQNVGPRMCQQRCSQFKACKAVSFKRSSLYCELLKNHSPAMLVDDTEFMLYDSGSFDISESACWPNSCTVHQRCIVVNTGSPICIIHRDQFTSDEINLIIEERKYEIKDIARGKKAFQYPDYPLSDPDYMERVASRAIDGNVATYSHTCNKYSPIHTVIYLMIDLLNDFLVTEIGIINRKDCCGHRLHKVDITVGLTETNRTFCGHFVGPGTLEQHINITCPGMLLGRFVKLTYTDTKYKEPILHVAEVSIFAYA